MRWTKLAPGRYGLERNGHEYRVTRREAHKSFYWAVDCDGRSLPSARTLGDAKWTAEHDKTPAVVECRAKYHRQIGRCPASSAAKGVR